MSSLTRGNDRRSLTNDSSMMRSSARRLEQQGFGRAAEQMALQGEQQRIAERAGRGSGIRSAEEETARNKAELQTRRAMVDDTADAYFAGQKPREAGQAPAAGQAPIAGQAPARESFADTDRRKREELTAAGAFGRGAQIKQEQRIAAESAPKPEARISSPMRKPTDPMLVGARGIVEDEKTAKQKAINDSILAPMRAERAAKEQADAANKAQIAERGTTRSLLRDGDKITGASSGAAVLDSARKSMPVMDKASAIKSIGDSSEALLANQSALDDIDMGLADNLDYGGSFDTSKTPTIKDALRSDVASVAGNISNATVNATSKVRDTASNLKDTAVSGAKTAADLLRKTPNTVNQVVEATGNAVRRGVATVTPGRTGDILRRNLRR